jgi:hypothetical protein
MTRIVTPFAGVKGNDPDSYSPLKDVVNESLGDWRKLRLLYPPHPLCPAFRPTAAAPLICSLPGAESQIP